MAQIYEQYWSYTAAFTDLYGSKAINTLKTCVEFLDKHEGEFFSKDTYEDLQYEIKSVLGIDLISIRKAINQFVKLGFLKPMLAGYNPETIEFLQATSSSKRKSIMSKIIYKYANFDNSMTKPVYSNNKQINFLLKTMEEIGHLSEKELTAMMTVNIAQHQKGFLTPTELSQYYRSANLCGFIDRKYNQIAHLKNLLGKLDDLVSYDGAIYLETDAKRLFGDDLSVKQIVHEPYLQRVYNCELVDESKTIFGSSKPQSMLQGVGTEILVPSHIKPIKVATDKELFDVNNGLLLPKQADNLFEQGYFTFNEDGTLELSSLLGEGMHQYLSHAKLSKACINEKRQDYMEYHRKQVFLDR